ncbi:beta-galactosidase-like [Ornithodoros turicata]|uniref:beta-galactosidase-like n=1 Tax=Ornithodoros turicata TaxID=34597 RepID=UPI00313A29B7
MKIVRTCWIYSILGMTLALILLFHGLPHVYDALRLTMGSMPEASGSRFRSHIPNRSFIVDYENNVFLKDGKPFRIIAGSIHYFRVPYPLWRDRLYKLKACGLNTIDTYVEWSSHEPEPWDYVFEGYSNLKGFLNTAEDLGLLVIIRAGPYISADRDNGGMPYWLPRIDASVQLRTSGNAFQFHVDRWFSVLLVFLQYFLYENGGPVIMVQLEDEYGKFEPCDHEYMKYIYYTFRYHLGPKVALITSDHPEEKFIECGTVEGALATFVHDGKAATKKVVNITRAANKNRGPIMVKFFISTLSRWNKTSAAVDKKKLFRKLEEILKLNASVSFYMFHGGTNFGFGNSTHTTSYHADAPLSEWADPTDLYFEISRIIYRFNEASQAAYMRTPVIRMNLGELHLKACSPWNKVKKVFKEKGLLKTISSSSPVSFEVIKQDFGYVTYTAQVDFGLHRPSAALEIPRFADRAYVLSRDGFHVMNARVSKTKKIPVSKTEHVTIIVENGGRMNPDSPVPESKGILSNVTLRRRQLHKWSIEAFSLTQDPSLALLFNFMRNLSKANGTECLRTPTFCYGSFQLPQRSTALDTFLDPSGWTRGQAFINGLNLGRYRPTAGPQVTLYVPKHVMRPYPEINEVILMELEGIPRNKTVQLVDEAKVK